MKRTTKDLLLLIKIELDELDTVCQDIEDILSEEDRKLFFNVYAGQAKIHDLMNEAVELENKKSDDK